MIKEIPILLSTPMVVAVLDDIKSMTRRIAGLDVVNQDPGRWEYVRFYEGFAKFWGKHNATNEVYAKCRYGNPGDWLWVRETWLYNDDLNIPYAFKADYNEEHQNRLKGHWKPSIHMPKGASRIWLQVKEIRVERLNGITEENAKAEGVDAAGLYPGYNVSSKGKFEGLWNLINGDGSWDLNPWVWVIDFKVLSTTGKPKFKSLESIES